MIYYSTNNSKITATLEEAVVKGLASDRGLFMPERITKLPASFFEKIGGMSLQEISYTVASALFGEDVEDDVLKGIVYDAMNFDIPLVNVDGNKYLTAEILCALVSAMEVLYVSGRDDEIEEILKPELRKLSELNSIDDLQKYEDDMEEEQ